jgi:SagB-type dehydrogenase family enzyme
MPKVVWVALPLLVATAMLAWLMVRGRTPSRQAVNIVSSVLLLAYVATTAGLGIFWVANQQLPVFDWHYLFGYGTVLLVLVHLAFNFPLVWRFFVRRRKAAATPARRPAAGPVAARRGVLGALGVMAATGTAFVLGMRHGGRAPAPEQPSPAAANDAPAPDAAQSALALVERFHEHSSHSRAGVFARAPAVAWGDPPPPFKLHAGVPRVALSPVGASRAAAFDAAALGDVLWHTTGVTERRGGLYLRASPASGALFSTELYVAVRDVPGLAAGLWHYDPRGHALEHLRGEAADRLLAGAIPEAALGEAPAWVVATAMFRRTGHKYRDRTYRYVLADLGHALENLRVAAHARGARARFMTTFDESRAAQALGVDEAEEGVLAVIALAPDANLQRTPARPTQPRESGTAAPAGDVRPFGPQGPAESQGRWAPSHAEGYAQSPSGSGWQPAPVQRADGSRLGVTASVHAATSLRAAAPNAIRSNAPAAPHAGQSLEDLIELPSPQPVTPDWLRVIATRRSVRRYAGSPLPMEALAAVLSHMTTRHAAILSPAVRVNVVAHAVAGLEPGAYRYLPERHALVPRRVPVTGLRAASRAAALDQDVIGDAAAVFVLSIDRATFAADPAGAARGYRHAFLEAGLVGERVYLEAAARGLGACAVGAFYDDEASALAGVDPAREWVVHFAALGMKA